MEVTLTKDRNKGIDALRVVSMFMIVVMHILKQGGILETLAAQKNMQSYVAWLLEVIAFCSVNCYALISGYVGIQSKFKASRLLKLWLKVLFYSLSITVIFSVFYPGSVNQHMWIKAIFPIMSRQYWYVTCYFGLMIFMPILNEGLKNLEMKRFTWMIRASILFFSVLPCVLQGYPFNFVSGLDAFGSLNGYSVLWLLIMYLLGAYLRFSDSLRKIKNWMLILGLIFSVIITWGSIFLLPVWTLKRFGEVRYTTILLSYTSPTILLMSTCLLLLFTRWNMQNKVVGKGMSMAGIATLGVYLIHTNPLIWERLLKGFAVGYAIEPTIIMVGKIIVSAALIYLVCTLLDIIREMIFEGIFMLSKKILRKN